MICDCTGSMCALRILKSNFGINLQLTQPLKMTSVREATHAGSWYTNDRTIKHSTLLHKALRCLLKSMHGWLMSTSPTLHPPLKLPLFRKKTQKQLYHNQTCWVSVFRINSCPFIPLFKFCIGNRVNKSFLHSL